MEQARHLRQPWLLSRPVATLAILAIVVSTARANDPLPVRAVSAVESDAARLAQQHVNHTVECVRLETGNRLLGEEIDRLESLGRTDSAGVKLIRDLASMDDELRRTLADLLQGNADVLAENLTDSVSQLSAKTDETGLVWLATRSALNRTEMQLFEIRGLGHLAGQFASLLSVDKRWFWLFGLIAVATLLAVVCHDRRREIRKRLNGGRPKAMGLSRMLAVLLLLLAAATITTFVLGDRVYEALLTVGAEEPESPRTRLEAEITQLQTRQAELRTARQPLEEKRTKLQDAWLARLSAGLPAGNRLPDRWQQVRHATIDGRETVAVLRTVSAGLTADRARLEELTEELQSQQAAARWLLRLRRGIRGLLGLALLGLTASGGVWFWVGVARRRRATADTCPLCLGTGSLEVAPAPARGAKELQAVYCRHVISREPYEECDFSFKQAYRPMTKLCFPTLGIPQAGKTHWAAMLYWILNQGNYPKTVEFERVRSQSSDDFDRIVEEILISRIGTAATQQDRIPHPLVFNFRDHDPLGRSNLLVNLFDYSGEVTSEMDSADYRRQRALDGDGFLFFLDPTYPSEVQAKALADFREDLRLIKGVKAGRRLRTPVALCVSKIDLLVGQDYRLDDGSDAITQFYEDLSRIDPSGESTRLSVLEQRSQLTRELRDVIWPGWQIERQIDDLFGGRFAFFPLTPVGLDGRGETDLSLRTISPFGLLEPLLWLLQMTGYPVLD